MAVLYDSPQNAVPPGTGDGGAVGPDMYLECVLGPPHFAPYVLPAGVLINEDAQLIIESFDANAENDLYVTIIYQKLRI